MEENNEVNTKLLEKMYNLGKVKDPNANLPEEHLRKAPEKRPVKLPANFIEKYVNLGKTKPEETTQPVPPNQQGTAPELPQSPKP